MNKNLVISVLAILVIGLGGYAVWQNKVQEGQIMQMQQVMQSAQQVVSNPSTQPMQTSPSTPASVSKPSTDIADPNDSNLHTYTSYNLGVQFNYLKDGGLGNSTSITPVESLNHITFPIDPESFITVYNRLPNESVDQALQRDLPQEFKNSNCSVRLISSNEYAIFDSRLAVGQYNREGNYMYLGDNNQYSNFCSPDYTLPFIIASQSPSNIYYIGYETQAVSFFANEDHSKQWFETVQFISK